MGEVLAGISVVEIGSGEAASITGMLLADFGATVVKVDAGPPQGELTHEELLWHRGKQRLRSAAVDPIRRQEATDLLSVADVCTLSQGWQEVIGEDHLTAARNRNPQLIVLDMPPMPEEVPWAGGGESHGLLAAQMGLTARQASFDGNPVESVYPHLTSVHGAWAACCAASALVERQSSGHGQVIGVDGWHAALVTLLSLLSVDVDLDDPPTDIGPFGRHPMYTIFPTGDGTWLACGALGTKFELQLLELLGIQGILDDPRLEGDLSRISQPTIFSWVRAQVADAFLEKEREEWLSMLSARGIPCGPVATRDEWFDLPQIAEIGMRVDVQDPDLGHIALPGAPIQFNGGPVAPRWLTRAGSAYSPTASPRQADGSTSQPPLRSPRPQLRRGPLAGVRVLNVGSFVAGPYSGSLLAHLGADVIKVEPTTGDPFRVTGFMYSRGMRSVAVDLTRAEGREVFLELVASSDVLTSSLRPGVLGKLGLDPDALLQARKDLVTVDLSGFGGQGTMAGRPGVDMVVQAMSGMMSGQGGADEPVANTLAIIDFTTAVLIALGASLGVFHRNRTETPQSASLSLAATSTYLQSPALIRVNGRGASGYVGGRDFKGSSSGDRLYRTSDGWIRIQSQRARLTPDRLRDHGVLIDREAYLADPIEAMSRTLGRLTTTAALQALHAADVSAAEVRRITQVLRDETLLRRGLIQVFPASGGGYYTAPVRFADFGRTAHPTLATTPGAGEHTREVLSELFDSGSLDRLLESGVITAGGPMPQRLGAVYR